MTARIQAQANQSPITQLIDFAIPLAACNHVKPDQLEQLYLLDAVAARWLGERGIPLPTWEPVATPEGCWQIKAIGQTKIPTSQDYAGGIMLRDLTAWAAQLRALETAAQHQAEPTAKTKPPSTRTEDIEKLTHGETVVLGVVRELLTKGNRVIRSARVSKASTYDDDYTRTLLASLVRKGELTHTKKEGYRLCNRAGNV